MPVQHQSVWIAEGKASSLHHSRKWALSSRSGPVKSLEPFIPTKQDIHTTAYQATLKYAYEVCD